MVGTGALPKNCLYSVGLTQSTSAALSLRRQMIWPLGVVQAAFIEVPAKLFSTFFGT